MSCYKLGELFAGAGGLAWGAKNATVENCTSKILHVWANDCDPNACNTYRKNILSNNPQNVICCDVGNLNLNKLEKIDAFSFGFPCNDFSIAGDRKGFGGKYGLLYEYGVKVLKIFKPLWFVAENVKGLSSTGKGEVQKKIFKSFNEAGYNIFPHLYKFEEYGIPQTRHRIIIVGIRKDISKKFNPPSSEKYRNCDISSKNALENPPITNEMANNERTQQASNVVERLKYIKPGNNAFNSDIPEEYQLHVKGAKLSSIYRRLDPDKPAYTVTGSGGGGTHIYHYSEPRALTNRERARLQTFPDDFVFCGNKESVRRQIGMAVPCHGAKIIFEAVLKTFEDIEYDSVDCNIEWNNEK